MSNFSPKLENQTEEQLLKDINAVGPAIASLASDELTRRVNKALLSEVADLNKNLKASGHRMEKFTLLLIIIALIQIVVAIFQSILSIVPPTILPWFGVVWMIILGLFIYYIFHKFESYI